VTAFLLLPTMDESVGPFFLFLWANSLLILGIHEAIVKPIAMSVVQWGAPRGISTVLTLADRLVPQLLAEGLNGADLEQRLRDAAAQATGDDRWLRTSMAPVWRSFDPRVLLDHQPKHGAPAEALIDLIPSTEKAS
jgi:hypothetical protein